MGVGSRKLFLIANPADVINNLRRAEPTAYCHLPTAYCFLCQTA